MESEAITTPFWTRVVADDVFRDAVVSDPLRALAETTGVEVSADQVRQLEEMDLDERREFVTDVVRQIHMRGARARFGDLGEDGRIGGDPDLDTGRD